MTMLLVGHIAGKSKCPTTPTCNTPRQPFYRNLSHRNVSLYYIYNETSCLCEDVLIEECHNTFDTRFSCVSQCETGQGAPLCVGDPVNAVNNSDITSTTISTVGSRDDSQGDGNYSSESYYFELEVPFEAYFYNATSMECEEYFAYEMPNRSAVTNFFFSDIFCEYECKGFNISNINGSEAKLHFQRP
uniref:Pancreatic trypsin inhibitor n=1 Tax=Rhipicephalus zambeziensis TaxID=60191 RepID=A0A224Y2F6_9ACAR